MWKLSFFNRTFYLLKNFLDNVNVKTIFYIRNDLIIIFINIYEKTCKLISRQTFNINISIGLIL